MEQPERSCADFKNGSFKYNYVIAGEERSATFVRNDSIEIDYYEGKIDTINVRWINACEYVARSKNPKSLAEKKAFHFKILNTTKNSYTFEYTPVVKSKKDDYTTYKGTAYKTD
jgi:hypothetical protein